MAVSPGEKKSGRIYEVTVRQDLLYSGNGYQVCKKVKRETGMEPEFLVESKAPNEITGLFVHVAYVCRYFRKCLG